eukprot:403359917
MPIQDQISTLFQRKCIPRILFSGLIAGYTSTGSKKYAITFAQDTTICRDIEASPTETVFYISGHTYSNSIRCSGSFGNYDQMIGKFTQNTGAQNWLYTLGGTQTEFLEGLTVSNDGTKVYAVGSTYSISYGDRDHSFLAFTTSGTGALLFYKRYGCERWDFLEAAAVDKNSNYLYLSGGTSCYNVVSANTWDIPLFKWNITSSSIEWGVIFGHPTMDDHATRMAFSVYDNSIFLAIRTGDNDNIMSGGFVQISNEGIQTMGYTFAGTSQPDYCKDIATSEDGRVIFLSCYSSSSGFASAGGTAVYILKINTVSGTLMSMKKFDLNRNEVSYGIASDPYGFIALSFSTDSTTSTWANSDTTNGIYYKSAGVFKFTNELSDFSVFTDTPAALCSQSTTSMGYVSQSWADGSPSVSMHKVYPPLIQDHTYNVGTSVSILLNKFCFDTILTYVDVAGIDFNSSTTITTSYLPTGLVFNWATQKITGIPTVSGIYAIKLYKSVSGSGDASSTFLLTIKAGEIVQTTSNNFQMIPDTLIAGKYYYYHFDPKTYFNDDGTFTYTVKQIAVKSKDTLTYSALPTWLQFNSLNYTFYGTPTNIDYTTFPQDIEILLFVTDSQGNIIVSESSNLTIINSKPYVDPLLSFKSSYCLTKNQNFYQLFDIDYFIDDDKQDIQKTIKFQPAISYPYLGIYYDTRDIALFGKPTSQAKLNGYIEGSDGFSTAQLFFDLIITEAPQFDMTYCNQFRTLSKIHQAALQQISLQL